MITIHRYASYADIFYPIAFHRNMFHCIKEEYDVDVPAHDTETKLSQHVTMLTASKLEFAVARGPTSGLVHYITMIDYNKVSFKPKGLITSCFKAHKTHISEVKLCKHILLVGGGKIYTPGFSNVLT